MEYATDTSFSATVLGFHGESDGGMGSWCRWNNLSLFWGSMEHVYFPREHGTEISVHDLADGRLGCGRWRGDNPLLLWDVVGSSQPGNDFQQSLFNLHG
jgi:hypothetical protein